MADNDRIAALEKNEAVTLVRIEHIAEHLDEIKTKQTAMDLKLDQIHQTVIKAGAVGGAAWAMSGGVGRFLQSVIIAAAGGLAALFGQSIVR